jgi:hypothetical protein
MKGEGPEAGDGGAPIRSKGLNRKRSDDILILTSAAELSRQLSSQPLLSHSEHGEDPDTEAKVIQPPFSFLSTYCSS